jgi:hypothetical protein
LREGDAWEGDFQFSGKGDACLRTFSEVCGDVVDDEFGPLGVDLYVGGGDAKLKQGVRDGVKIGFGLIGGDVEVGLKDNVFLLSAAAEGKGDASVLKGCVDGSEDFDVRDRVWDWCR